MTVSVKDMERVKRELLTSIGHDLECLSRGLSETTHELVRAAVSQRLSGVVARLERGIASGLAVIAQDVKQRIDKEVKERYARIAGEVRVRIRRLETKAAGEGKLTRYDPVMTTKMPALLGDEMTTVQAECQKMLDKLNHQILNAKNQLGGPPLRPASSAKRNTSMRAAHAK